ncbi:hypothetical protein [endosymbiont GvMRE of Glomus versiforme]|uniref:hypothetical protein n=1 Tax=endosymbiont GvMRE of Glomus versiforme TaxID=2039283 RepID=UPI000EC535CA|nr:hypothetical protein [endosymbiont GvMRE of Glomus versiforme]RHZ35534.1 hypothetical protein GvMRE_IIg197 [endosymbiont GvMRE of Glomus versiforme]
MARTKIIINNDKNSNYLKLLSRQINKALFLSNYLSSYYFELTNIAYTIYNLHTTIKKNNQL